MTRRPGAHHQRPLTASVTTGKVPDEVMTVALSLADGHPRRVKTINPTTVLVNAHPDVVEIVRRAEREGEGS